MLRRVKVKSPADCFDYVTDGFETDKPAIISIQKSADGGHGYCPGGLNCSSAGAVCI